MTATASDAFLREFKQKDVTVKLCRSILAVIPFAPRFQWYSSIFEAAEHLHGDADEATRAAVVARASEILESKPFKDVLWAAESLDTGDKGISLYTGVRTAFSFFFGDRSNAFDVAAQQRADGALKALGLSYMVHRLFDGPVLEQIDHLLVLPTGRSLLVYYGAIEVALPFTDEVLEGGEHFVSGLVKKYATGSTMKLSPIAGADGVEGAQSALPYLIDLLDRVTYHSVTHLDAITQSARKYLPKAFAKGDNLPSLVATGADAMPVYMFLVARLVVEAALWQARAELDDAFPSQPVSELAIAALPGANPSAGPNPFATAHDTPSADPSSPGNPFAGPSEAAAGAVVAGAATAGAVASGNPFASTTVQPASGNPFAATTAAPAAPAAQPSAQPTTAPAKTAPAKTANPFAARITNDAVSETASPFSVPDHLAEPADPTDAGPGEALHSSYLRRDGSNEFWLIFTQDGVFTDSPPATLQPVDWDAHRRSGHQVGRYHRAGDQLTIRYGDGQRHTLTIDKQAYALVVDGVSCRMADFDLSGRQLEGSWRARDGSRKLTFGADNSLSSERGVGRYQMGPREVTLTWADGSEQLPFLSDLKPRSRTPDVIYIGGLAYDRDR